MDRIPSSSLTDSLLSFLIKTLPVPVSFSVCEVGDSQCVLSEGMPSSFVISVTSVL